MEKLILKWVTGCSGVLTILVCVCLYWFPSIKATMVIAEGNAQESIEIEANGASAKDKEQLNIEIPKGLEGNEVQITNDYVTQTIYVRFAKGVDDYSKEYSVRGSSDHIASLSYYKDGEAGVLAIGLDRVYEISYSFRDGFLYMDFIDPHDLYDKIIVVDAGHGGRAPGAVKKEISEKTLNLEIVKALKVIFEEVDDQNIKVYYTRLDDDANPTLAQRVGLANKSDADLFISVHCNSSTTGKFTDRNGTLVLYNPNDNSEHSSKMLAELCLSNVLASCGSNDLGLVDGDYIYIVRNSQVPVSLIEVGYMSNHVELDNLSNPDYQKKVAQGIYNATVQAFKEGF